MPFFIVLLIGLVIRLIFVGNTGFIADIAFWKSWSLAASDHGIVWTAFNTNINYPPGFIYVLWVMGKIYTLFGNPHNFNDFWRENNFGFLLASKSIAIASDIAIASLIYWFFSQKKKLKELGITLLNKTGDTDGGTLSKNPQRQSEQGFLMGVIRGRTRFILGNLPILLSAVFFLHPVVILDSALWGQVESFGLLFTLVAIVLVLYKKPYLGSFIFIIGTQMKLQNIIFIPLFFIFIWRYFDFKTLIKSLGFAALSFFLVNLPFVITHNMTKVLDLLTTNSDYFPLLSLNAHNLWWIVSGGNGMGVNDKITTLGILNAKTLGLILFSGSYLLSTLLIVKKPTPRNLFLAISLGIFSFFLWTTQSHERYSYPVIVLLLFFYPFLSSKSHNFFTSKFFFWSVYMFLSFAVFLNMHNGLIANYPENGFDIITFFTRSNLPTIGIVNSVFLIILFFLLLPFVFEEISAWFGAICIGVIGIGVIALNFSYILGNSYPLTKLKPISVKQDFGILQVNKSVNSYTGWKAWNRLGSDYFYYEKGLGTHANSDLVFDIEGKFTRFATDYGINTEAGTQASVIFIIKGDQKELYKSKKMGRFDFPEHVTVDITGVKHLELIVADAGDGINNDHADWLNPVLIK